MKITLLLTINNRPPDVIQKVAESFALPGNKTDEIIVVLDRPERESDQAAREHWSRLGARFITVDGNPGWLCPSRAWNKGLEAATGDFIYMISSEVVQDEGNVDKARDICQDHRTAVFGACDNSERVQLVTGAPPGLLASSKMPRPLGFIACTTRHSLRVAGGWDEGFMQGFWYEDDDLWYRVWNTGVRFVFDDSIHGVHIHHDHPHLVKAGIQRNAIYIKGKHGTTRPLQEKIQDRVVYNENPTRLVWEHHPKSRLIT